MSTAQETVASDIEKLSRDWAAVKKGDRRSVSLEEVVRSMNRLRENLSSFRKHVLKLYSAAELLTSEIMSTPVAAEAWEDLHSVYAAVLDRFMNLPKIEPEIDELIDELRGVLRDLEARSDQECQAYRETGHLLSSEANARVLEGSIKEAREGRLEVFETAVDFKTSLRSRK
jgi:ElaB/YqjD/DUF883 family membrane-anchored ribosome-binding protein